MQTFVYTYDNRQKERKIRKLRYADCGVDKNQHTEICQFQTSKTYQLDKRLGFLRSISQFEISKDPKRMAGFCSFFLTDSEHGTLKYEGTFEPIPYKSCFRADIEKEYEGRGFGLDGTFKGKFFDISVSYFLDGTRVIRATEQMPNI